MSTLTFTDDMARIQRALAQCHDMVLRRSRVLEAPQLRYVLEDDPHATYRGTPRSDHDRRAVRAAHPELARAGA